MPFPSVYGALFLMPLQGIKLLKRNIASCLTLLIFLLLNQASWAQARDSHIPSQSNDEIKAAHILKFQKYATWPEEAMSETTPLVIGVVGADEVAATLEQLAAKHEQSKQAVIIKKLATGESVEGIHLLYIGEDHTWELTDWVAQASGKPILFVTDSGNSMPPGSIINFIQEDNRIRFDISLTAAEMSKIKLSAALLTVARQVYGGKS